MAQHETVEALIVGGHAGLLLGTALAHAGIGVGLIERQPQEAIAEAPADGRTLALLAGSVGIVRRVGAWRRWHRSRRRSSASRSPTSMAAGRFTTTAPWQGPFGIGVEQTGVLRKPSSRPSSTMPGRRRTCATRSPRCGASATQRC